ncbi:hypothetical protein [Paracoccus angustae]
MKPLLIGYVCCLAGKRDLAARKGFFVGAGPQPGSPLALPNQMLL